MKNIFKKFISILLCILMLTACTNKNNSTKKETDKNKTENKAPITIEYWHTMRESKGVAMDEVVKKFNETIGKEKGIVVNSSYQGDDVNEKLKTLVQSKDTKNFPDVAQVAGAATPTVMNYELTVTPKEMYDKKENIIVPFEDLVPNAVRAFSYNNELKVMPFNVSSILLYINIDAFKEAGLDPENPPKTIDELAKAAEKLKKLDGDRIVRNGLNVQIKRYQMANFIGGQGEFNFIGNNEGGRSGAMTELICGPELENFLNEWKKVVDSAAYQPVENNINEEFSLGLHGMVIMSSARIGIMEKMIGDKFNWKTANLPKVNINDKGGTAVGGSGVAMFKTGDDEKLKAAWLFTQFLASPEAQISFDKATGYLPVNIKAIEDKDYQSYLKEKPNYDVPVKQMQNSNQNVQEPFDAINWVINDIIDAEMQKFGKNEQDVKTTKENILNNINTKLKEYAETNKN